MATYTQASAPATLHGLAAGSPSGLASPVVRARAALRLGLAGGGTDVAPYCELYGGSVLNATLDRYAYAVIATLDRPQVRFVATDRLTELVKPVDDPLEFNGMLDLHKAAYREMMDRYNGGRRLPLEITTFCDAPVGSGLGASSAVVVVLIRALAELLNLPLDDYLIADLAFKIERVDCGLQGGKQDHFSAAFGGFNFMEFHADGRTVVNPLRIKNWIICELEASLVLCDTGVSRESATIIADQSENVRAGQAEAVKALHAVKREALAMKEYLLKGDFAGIVDALRQGWEGKKHSAKTVSTPHIEELLDAALSAGALAGKVSGAGGGGFVLFFVPPARRMNVIRALKRFGGQVSNCHFTRHGVQAWRV